jgi:hypothetical protein
VLRRVVLVRTGVSEELSPSIIGVTRIGELGTTLALTSQQRTLRKNTLFLQFSSETSVHARVTRRNIPEDGFLASTEFACTYVLPGLGSLCSDALLTLKLRYCKAVFLRTVCQSRFQPLETFIHAIQLGAEDGTCYELPSPPPLPPDSDQAAMFRLI